MNDLVTINSNSTTCNARDLHARLEVGRNFSNWIKGRISEYGFVEGEDYTCTPNLDTPNPAYRDSPNLGSAKSNDLASSWGGDHRSIDYRITLGMAKELAMLENNAKGREVRRYFITVEKELKRLHAQDLERLGDQMERLNLSTYQTELKLEDFSKTRSNLAQASIEKRARAYEKLIYKVFSKKLDTCALELAQRAQNDPRKTLKAHAQAITATWTHYDATDVDTLIAILKP